MQQKYLHEHCLSNNLINNKLRQEMYLKHLREVEKISNREADSLKRNLQQYRSIAEIHKNNKVKAYEFKLQEKQKSIEQKNVKIYSKISSIGSDKSISNRKTKSFSLQGSNDLQNVQKSIDSKQRSLNTSPKSPKQSFHYAYRRKQQQMIQHENAKLMKAILSQKSTILPAINQSKRRAQSNLESSRKSSNRYSQGSKQIEYNSMTPDEK